MASKRKIRHQNDLLVEAVSNAEQVSGENAKSLHLALVELAAYREAIQAIEAEKHLYQTAFYQTVGQLSVYLNVEGSLSEWAENRLDEVRREIATHTSLD